MSAPRAPTAPVVHIPVPLVLLLGALAAVGPFTIDLYLPAFSAIASDLEATPDQVQSTLSAYFIGLAVGQMFLGPLSDRLGRRSPLLAGLALYTVASMGCMVAPSIEALAALRFLQALGACAGMVASRAVLRDLYSPRDMARALSLIMLVMGIAPIVAPLVGSALAASFGWRLLFGLLAVYGGAIFVAVGLRLDETLAEPRRLSVGRILTTYVDLARLRPFTAYALSGALVQGGLFVYIASSSFVFTEVYGLSSTQFALLFGVNATGLIAASQLNERWLRRSTPQAIVPVVLGTFLVASLLMTAAAVTGLGGVGGVAVPLFVCIFCLGFGFPNTTAAAMEPVGDRAGMAAALLGTVQFGVAGLASYVAGLLFDHTAVPMAACMAVCGVLAVLSLVALLPRPQTA